MCVVAGALRALDSLLSHYNCLTPPRINLSYHSPRATQERGDLEAEQRVSDVITHNLSVLHFVGIQRHSSPGDILEGDCEIEYSQAPRCSEAHQLSRDFITCWHLCSRLGVREGRETRSTSGPSCQPTSTKPQREAVAAESSSAFLQDRGRHCLPLLIIIKTLMRLTAVTFLSPVQPPPPPRPKIKDKQS